MTLLFASLIEGGAEFVGELTSGGVSYPHLRTWTKGRERQVLDRFIARATALIFEHGSTTVLGRQKRQAILDIGRATR